MRTTSLSRYLALGLSASFAFLAHGAAANTVAYAEDFFTGGDFVRLDFINPPVYIGSFDYLFAAGAFADNDFSNEYMIWYATGDLYSIDVLSAYPTLIGTPNTSGNGPLAMHWDPVSGQMFLVALQCSLQGCFKGGFQPKCQIEVRPPLPLQQKNAFHQDDLGVFISKRVNVTLPFRLVVEGDRER